MIDSIRLYCHYIGISIRAQMQYRASFVMMTIGQIFTSGMEFAAIWALFDRFGGLRGWSLAEAAVLYGMVHVAFALAEGIARGFDMFPAMVKAGEFDRILLRPRGTVFQLLGQDLQLLRVGRLGQGVAVLVWAMSALGMGASPSAMLLIVVAILGGACLFAGLFVLQATMAFWTIDSLEIVNTLTYGGVETAQFPLSIYRPWFRRFFTFVVPLACINYLPSLALLGRAGPSDPATVLFRFTPIVGVVFLLVSLRVWKIGVRHYCSTGS